MKRDTSDYRPTFNFLTSLSTTRIRLNRRNSCIRDFSLYTTAGICIARHYQLSPTLYLSISLNSIYVTAHATVSQILPPQFHLFLPDCLHGLLPGPFLLSYSVFVFSFPYFFVSVPCTRLSWPCHQLLSARKSTISYRILATAFIHREHIISAQKFASESRHGLLCTSTVN